MVINYAQHFFSRGRENFSKGVSPSKTQVDWWVVSRSNRFKTDQSDASVFLPKKLILAFAFVALALSFFQVYARKSWSRVFVNHFAAQARFGACLFAKFFFEKFICKTLPESVNEMWTTKTFSFAEVGPAKVSNWHRSHFQDTIVHEMEFFNATENLYWRVTKTFGQTFTACAVNS